MGDRLLQVAAFIVAGIVFIGNVKFDDLIGLNNTTPTPKGTATDRVRHFDKIVMEEARLHGVSPDLVRAVILVESAGDPNAISRAGAKGLMQLMDGTGKEMGVKNSFNPNENIRGGVKYLALMLARYDGDVERALAAYNAGPANVDKYGGVPPFRETQAYVERVIYHYERLEGKLGIATRRPT